MFRCYSLIQHYNEEYAIMLANKHRRHIISNRIAVTTGFVLLLAQATQQAPQPVNIHTDQTNTVTTQVSDNQTTSRYHVLLDLGLLLLGR